MERQIIESGKEAHVTKVISAFMVTAVLQGVYFLWALYNKAILVACAFLIGMVFFGYIGIIMLNAFKETKNMSKK